jgi:hypothetical protein
MVESTMGLSSPKPSVELFAAVPEVPVIVRVVYVYLPPYVPDKFFSF